MKFLVVRIDIRTREINVAGWMNLFYWQACLCAPTALRFLGADSVGFWRFVTESRLNFVWLVKAFFYISFFFFHRYVWAQGKPKSMAGESSADSSMSLEMAGCEYEFSPNSSETEGESSSTHDHSSTTMPCSSCLRHGASAVNPPSGSLYLCTFDVPEKLLFHPQVAMRLNGMGPRGLAMRKTFDVPMLSMKEEKVKKPRKQCRNCRAAS